jgi:hypothetical protein
MEILVHPVHGQQTNVRSAMLQQWGFWLNRAPGIRTTSKFVSSGQRVPRVKKNNKQCISLVQYRESQ